MMKLADRVNQIHPYPTPAFNSGFTRYMPFGGVEKYARFSYATSMENIKKDMHRIEVTIKNLK